MDNCQRLLTNSLRFQFLKERNLFFKYDATFTPELPSPERRSLVIQQLHRDLGTLYLFDDIRNVLYLPQNISAILSCQETASPGPDTNENDQCVQVNHMFVRVPYDEDKMMEVTLRRIFVSSTSTSRHSHSFLTALVRRGFEILGLKKLGDGVYDTKIFLEEHQIDIQCGIRFGTREIDQAPMLWMEPSFRVTSRQSLRDVLGSIVSETQEDRMASFEKLVISKMIRTPTRTPTFHQVHRVRWDLNPRSTFTYNDELVSFAHFYREQYGIKIIDLSQPLLITICGKLPTKGGNSIYHCLQPMIVDAEKNLLVHIPELCFTCDLKIVSKTIPKLSKEIEDIVNPSPQKMVCILRSYISQINCEQAQKLFNNWNVQLDPSLVEVVGSILPGPLIKMNASTTLDFSDAKYFDSIEAQLRFWSLSGTVPFYSCVPLLDWILVCTAEDKQLATKFADVFQSECTNMGLEHIGNKSVYELVVIDRSANDKESLETRFVDAIRRTNKTQFFVFILPRGASKTVYKAVKNVCTVEFGVSSQCVRSSTIISKGFVGIVRAIGRQICSKLGGAPWALDIQGKEPEAVMTVGIDAYHSRRRVCSVYAVVFTLNPQCTKYYTRTVRNPPTQETGDTLSPMFFDACVEYYKECGRWPSHIIVFRDGVSNMYLSIIKDHEIAQIKRTLEVLKPQPKLTVVLIQKHTTDRLVLLHGEDMLNPMPGTIVDTTITRTEYEDFFLFSQMTRGNVPVQPTRCVVLEDEVGDLEFIKKATYAASFTYFNWPGSIRIPAVCQYAHKAAGFVGYILKDNPSECLQNTLFYL